MTQPRSPRTHSHSHLRTAALALFLLPATLGLTQGSPMTLRSAPSGPAITTTSAGFTALPDMRGSIVTAAGADLEITVSGEAYTTAGKRMFVRALVDGQVASPSDVVLAVGDYRGTRSFTFTRHNLSAGEHIVQIEWFTDSGGTASFGDRSLVLLASPEGSSSQALSVTAAPSGAERTTTSVGFVDIPDMIGNITTAQGADLEIAFSAEAYTSNGKRMFVRALLDGQPAGPSDVVLAAGGYAGTESFTFVRRNVAAGGHTVRMQWHVDAGGTASIGDRTLSLYSAPAAAPSGALTVAAAPSGAAKSTSSTAFVDLPGLSTTISTVRGGSLEITVAGEVWTSGSDRLFVRALVDGRPAGPSDVVLTRGGFGGTHRFSFVARNLSKGAHNVRLQWHTDSGGTAYIGDRSLAVTSAQPQLHMLILTPDEFADELVPLVTWKEETGRPTALVTLEDIATLQLGQVRDQPEQVKRFIADFVGTHGVDHVMLVGDSDKFPVRYVRAYNTEWGTKYYPSDLYYMDLFDSNRGFDDWDGNSNTHIGEIDFAGGTDMSKVNIDGIDMVPDVSLGRVPASTSAEVETYVNKVISYESQAAPSWFRNALLVVDGGGGGFGSSTKMDAVVPFLKGSTVTKMYQDNTPYDTMSFAQRAAAVNSAVNSGVGLMSWYGHANRTLFAGFYDSNQISGLTNSDGRLPIVFATGCYAGRFHFDRSNYMDTDGNVWSGGGTSHPEPRPVQPSTYDSYGNESMAEHLLVKNSTGAIGFVGSVSKAEHGAWLDTTHGLNLYFYQQYAAGTREMGKLWSGTLAKYAADLRSPTIGGMYYYSFVHIHKMLLFGDPSLALPRLPSVDIRANGSNGPVSVAANSTVQLSLSLDPGTFAGAEADWFVVSSSSSGWSYFSGVGNLWLPGIVATHQGPLFGLGGLPVATAALPAGTHRFYLAVDTKKNGAADMPELFFDAVEVSAN